MKFGIAHKVIAVVSAVVLILNLAAISILASLASANGVKQFKDDAEQTLRGVAAQLDEEIYRQIIEEWDMESDEFKEQQALLTKTEKAADIQYLYTYFYDRSETKGRYIVDSGDMTSTQWCPLGKEESYSQDEYDEALEVLEKGQALISDMEESEEWGKIMTIEVPFYIGDKYIIVLSGDFSAQQVVSQSNRFKRQLAISVWIMALIQMIVIYFAIMKLLRQGFIELNEVIDVTAELDFSDMNAGSRLAKRQDELGNMAGRLMQMREKLKEKAEATEKAAAKVYELTGDIQEKMDQNAVSVENISHSIADLASGINDQATGAAKSQELTFELDRRIKELNEQITSIRAIASKTQSTSDENRKVISSLRDKAADNGDITRKVNEKMSCLTKSSYEIQGIMDVIEGVAEETSLLALNAAIEASRAGEAGKSFGVVAGEIKNLSVDTAASTNKIKEIIQQILGDIESMYEEITMLTYSNIDAEAATAEVMASSHEMEKMVDTILTGTETLFDNMKEIETYKNTVFQSASDLTVMSQEYSAISEEIASCTEEEMVINKAVLGVTAQLVHTAEVLQDTLSDYQL